MNAERELALNPIVQDSVQHNAKVRNFTLEEHRDTGVLLTNVFVKTLTNIHSLSSSLLGITAGTLRLESTFGFLFFLVSTFAVSALVYLGPAKGQPERFFYSQFKDLWTAEIVGGLMSYILTWTLVYNLVGT